MRLGENDQGSGDWHGRDVRRLEGLIQDCKNKTLRGEKDVVSLSRRWVNKRVGGCFWGMRRHALALPPIQTPPHKLLKDPRQRNPCRPQRRDKSEKAAEQYPSYVQTLFRKNTSLDFIQINWMDHRQNVKKEREKERERQRETFNVLFFFDKRYVVSIILFWWFKDVSSSLINSTNPQPLYLGVLYSKIKMNIFLEISVLSWNYFSFLYGSSFY